MDVHTLAKMTNKVDLNSVNPKGNAHNDCALLFSVFVLYKSVLLIITKK